MSPLYDFECQTCGVTSELFFKMAERPDWIACPLLCDGHAKRIISAPALQLDDGCTWIPDAALAVSQEHRYAKYGGEGKIENRTQFKGFMKDHPNIRPCDGPNLSEV